MAGCRIDRLQIARLTALDYLACHAQIGLRQIVALRLGDTVRIARHATACRIVRVAGSMPIPGPLPDIL